MTKTERTDLLGQVERMRANNRTEGARTADELRGTARTVTSAAGALLLVHLLTRTRILVAGLHLVRTGAALGQLPVDDARQDVRADVFDPENEIRNVHRTSLGGVEFDDFEFHNYSAPSSAGAAGAASAAAEAAFLMPAGKGRPAGAAFLTASRILT